MRILFLVFLSMVLAGEVSAGRLSGKITDKDKQAIIGAVVIVKGTSAGTVSDIDGNFSLNLPDGVYTLQISSLGFESLEMAGMQVIPTEDKTLSIVLEAAKQTELEEVVVRSSFKKESVAVLYTLQKKSAAISDGISAEQIQKSADRTTGEVLKRVGGTTVNEGKFVIVRGLSDRYNTALVDHAVLPSTEANTKAFSFDIIPAAIVDNIVIAKAATPELPGDFAGAAVQVLTKEMPSRNFQNIAISVGFNTASSFKSFKSGTRTSTDYLSFDNGSRALPKGFPKDAEEVNGLSQKANQAAAAQLPESATIKERAALPPVGIQASMGRVYSLKNNTKLGGIVALSYAHDESIERDVVRDYFQYKYKDQIYKFRSSLGVLANLSLQKKASKYTFKNLYNRVFNDQTLLREGTQQLNNKDIQYYAFDLNQKSLYKSSIVGSHQLRAEGKISWVASVANITNTQPDQKKITYSRYAGAASAEPFRAELGTLSKLNNRYYSKLTEDILTAGLNYARPYSLGGKTHHLKLGWNSQMRQRSFQARFMGLVLDEVKLDPEEANAIKTRPIESLYGSDLIKKGAYQLSELYDPANTYKAHSFTHAVFAQSDNQIGERLRIVWGARLESFQMHLSSQDNVADITLNRDWLSLLPSANFTYALNEKSNLRASYFRSLARPEFREIAPFAYYDYELPANTYGNIHLAQTNIDNMDIRYEIYPNSGEIFSVSAFYKRFQNPIEPKMYDVNSSGLERTYKNADQATNIGAELELRKSLNFISSSLANVSLYTNLAYIHSRVDLNSNISSVTGKVVGDVHRPLAGQSPYIINIGLDYQTLNKKLSLSANYNRIGRRIYLVSGELLPSVWENPRDLLDLQAQYQISKKCILKFQVKDLLNQAHVLYFDHNKSGDYDPQNRSSDEFGVLVQDQTFRTIPQTGTQFSIGFNMEL